MLNPILRITDGTETVNLIDLKGFTLNDWKPAVAEPKGGGVFRSSPMSSGRRLAYRMMDNVIDTFNLIGGKSSQDDMIASIQKLERLLEKSTEYWTSDFQNVPVWIEAKAATESLTRYAVIVDYRLTGFGGPYQQPFFGSDCSSATEAILVIEHKLWQETVPGETGECVELHNDTEYLHRDTGFDGTFYPGGSDYDCTYDRQDGDVGLVAHGLTVGHIGIFPRANSSSGIVFYDLPIPSNAIIDSASLRLTKYGVSTVGAASILVSAQSQFGGKIVSTTIVTQGTGYRNPKVRINDASVPKNYIPAYITAQYNISGQITQLNIINGGQGYSSPTLVIWDDVPIGYPGPGSGAMATCTTTPVGVDALPFDGTVEDYLNRTPVGGPVIELSFDEYPGSIDVTTLVKGVVNNTYWTSGDNLCLFLDSLGESYRQFCSWDEGVDIPSLYIMWTQDVDVAGTTKTCAQEVYISNKHTNFPITHIYVHDDSLGTYSDNEIGHDYSASSFPLFPYNPGAGVYPSVNDCIYFGSAESTLNSWNDAPFCSLVFDLQQGSFGIGTLIWEYYDGVTPPDGFTTFYPYGEEVALKIAGVGSIVWEQPDDWVTALGYLVAQNAYWIRCRIVSLSSAPPAIYPPYQWHRDIFTVINPYVDIDADEVPGDTTALARILFNSASGIGMPTDTVIMGLRSLSRGTNFSAYLNASDKPNPYIKTTLLSGSFVADSRAPTGRSFLCTNPSSHDALIWRINSKISNEYNGTYHAYVRCSQVGVAGGSVNLQLRVEQHAAINYSETNAIICGGDEITYVDLGQIAFPSGYTHLQGDSGSYYDVVLSAIIPLGEIVHIYDVVLIPSDEWVCSISAYNPAYSYTTLLRYGTGFDLDAIRNPRKYRSYLVSPELPPPPENPFLHTGLVYLCELSRVASGEPMFQANVDQRLWFFQVDSNLNTSSIQNCGAIRAERSARYLLARGKE
jgi:hypothetical protein